MLSNATSNQNPDVVSSRPKRSRAHNKKVKTGCGTCKKRHKKCDETRPACERCTSNGYVCDGYDTETTSPSAKTQVVPSMTHRPLMIPDWDVTELRYFDIFRRYSVPQLSGGFESDFWNRFLLRTAQSAPCVRHAAVALGALHEDTAHRRAVVSSKSSPAALPPMSHFVLREYSKALAAVTAHACQDGDEAAQVVLSVCVLFICFETLRGNHDTVLMHTKNGLRLLTDVVERAAKGGTVLAAISDGPVPLASILPVFTRLDVQALDLLDPVFLTTDGFDGLAPFKTMSPIPNAFDTLDEAKISLLDMEHANVHEIRKVIGKSQSAEPCDWPEADYNRLMEGKAFFSDRLKVWRKAFQPLVDRCELGFSNLWSQRATKVLLVHHKCVEMTLDRFPSRDEMYFDDVTPTFEEILNLARPAITAYQSEPYLTRLLILMDIGLAEPLFYVIRRCRHPKVRREALELLKACPGYEGIWQSQLAAHVGQRTMEMEEAASPGPVHTERDVPRHARFWEVLPLFGTGAPEGTLVCRFVNEKGTYVDEEFTNFHSA